MNETSSPEIQPEPQPQLVRIPRHVNVPRATHIILGFTVAVYVLQFLSVSFHGYAVPGLDWLELYGARFNEAMRAGEWWRFITPVFLHGSPMHIFFNMYALLSVGTFLEKQFGHGRFVALYFLAAFSGNVFSFLFAREGGFSVGASTAIFGLIAAEYIFFYQNRELFGSFARQAMGNTVMILVINLVIGLSPGIDNWGHIGGLLGGAMFAWFASPRWEAAGISPDIRLEDAREPRDVVTGALLVILVFAGLAAWELF